MNWVDVVIIVFLVVAAIKGYVDGFVLSLLNIAGLVISIIAAKLYFKELAQYLISSTQLYNKIYGFISKGLENNNMIGNYYNNVIEAGSQAGILNAAGTVSTIIIYIISILIIFFSVRLVFSIILHYLNTLVELPVLKQFNKMGGIVIGLAKGILGIMILFAFSVPLIQIFSIEWLPRALEQSSIAVYFYQYNFIISWATKMISNVLAH